MSSAQAISSSVPAGAVRPGASERRVLGLFTPAGALMAVLLTAAFAGLFFRWFRTQGLWSIRYPEDWAHAFFVPLISGYMILQRREELARLRPSTFWPGMIPLLLGIMCYFFFSVGAAGNHMFQGFSLIMAVFGTTTLLLGPAFVRPLFLPIAFLAFGVTISERIMIQLTFPLQLMASYGAWVLLNGVGALGGFMAERAGNTLQIFLDNGTALPPLDVAEACSGMRMVVAFFALGATVAILGTRHWWQRVALMLLVAPVAIAINIARVTVLGLLNLYDPNMVTGQFHTLVGTLLLLPGLGLFMLVVWSLNRVVREEEKRA